MSFPLPRACVMGHPVAHSRSPMIHGRTSCGMIGKPPLEIDLASLKAGAVVCDVTGWDGAHEPPQGTVDLPSPCGIFWGRAIENRSVLE